ncbi:MAG: methyltransferase domain-containing protein [Alphaproteobacteria bacterium]|nr:methyltransferase domain-containing protein [Alphaproteobacteria bacterium]
MFWPDVIDLKLFYTSPLGRVSESVIARCISHVWPEAGNECILGIGFTQPYLEPYRENAERIMALMPAAQGALHWPLDKPHNLTFLADEGDIPLPDESMSRVIVIHALENTEQRTHMMREIWRVLAPNGRVMVIAPNRRGVWARMPASPFAHGSPFTAAQLRTLLRDNQFTPYDAHYTLFTPPTTNEILLKASRFFEEVGKRFFTMFSGVIIMEGEKQIYAQVTQRPVRKQRSRHIGTAPQPVMTCDQS